MRKAESDWATVRGMVDALRSLESGSVLYKDLLASEVEQASLDSYLAGPRGRKSPNAAPTRTKSIVSTLLRMGGVVSGGAAIRAHFGLGEPRDYDVFFTDYSSWVKGVLASYDDPNVDVCLSLGEPWETFDLWASCISFDIQSFRFAPEFEEAFRTGVSGVRLEKVFHPVSTLRRMVRYSKNYGLKFRRSDVAEMLETFKVRRDSSLVKLVSSISV